MKPKQLWFKKKRLKQVLALVGILIITLSLSGCKKFVEADVSAETTKATSKEIQKKVEITTKQTEQLINEIETTDETTSGSFIEPQMDKNNSDDGVFTIDSDVYPLDSREITIRVDTSMYAYGDFQYSCIDLENLKNYSNLKRLNISSYNDAEVNRPINLINCDSTADLGNLEEVTLCMVSCEGDWLSEVSSLKTLDIEWSCLDWEFLHDLSQVETLILYRCDITELNFINNMKSLSELSLTNIDIERFEIDEENNSVKRLMLRENAFTDISDIAKLRKLEYLYISETNDVENQINELEKSLSACEINLIKESN